MTTKKHLPKKWKSLWFFIVPFLFLFLFKMFLNRPSEGDLKVIKSDEHNGSEGAAAVGDVGLPDVIDYSLHVKPILSDKCYACHGPDGGTREADFRIDTKEGAYAALKDDAHAFAIVPGDFENSIAMKRIFSEDPKTQMPPPESNLKLSGNEKQVLKKWIEQGAVWSDHWAFVKPKKKEVPGVGNTSWPKNEIDYFILAKIESEGLSPSEKADKETLLRRVYLDLTGLPPSLEDIDEFLSDQSSDAYEKVVDKLLASDAYGERMASGWMDIARYADSHGYQDDLERVMWPWRDWVIHAFNENLPYDKFIKWQLAGDLMPNASMEQIVASGFNRNHKITQEGGVIDEEYRVEYVVDRTSTTSKALMGLTMECARCHDHKYDPLSQEEFYGMYTFFNQLDEKGRIEYNETPAPFITLTDEEVNDNLSFIQMPDSVNKIDLMVMKDAPGLRKTYLLERGVYDAKGKEVSFNTPESVLEFSDKFENNRLGLADWFFDDDNPLTSRVYVNRLWQHMFGVGIVATSDDFGSQGALPTHPELLDWMAVSFKDSGWDIKAMLKKIAMSATYQQSSKITPKLLKTDPDNILLARAPRYKLPAEVIRDNVLATSGLLEEKIGGPSVKPYQPPGLWAETTSGVGLTKYIPDTGKSLYRRSLYTFWKRTVPPPSMITFDAATRDFCEVKRQKTSTPLQALVLLNDPQVVEASRVLATTTLQNETLSREERIKHIFRSVLSRYPSQKELENCISYLDDIEEDGDNSEEAFAILEIGVREIPADISKHQLRAYTLLANMIFNLDEAVTKI
ncbi:PSD1 and planctomycete cytochrome C domain-containing protein [Zhouia spongiae]|uniref:PSD1 and planctomycete cytochrome C domain-containing protein n=1 Tax=Zhouia spongiae TaxID=2202721 RepID=A0ABY3YNE8_9FLAO|nr:PSD1 and planctomycete cytochrome C domain-containing protein [Zhouia spongiae]UNY99203.1 PSD1 and planctomycete cytochrome C domain-containing protein [Zhouia spongiae]